MKKSHLLLVLSFVLANLFCLSLLRAESVASADTLAVSGKSVIFQQLD